MPRLGKYPHQLLVNSTSLVSVFIPNAVKSIGRYAVGDYHVLTNLHLTASVVEINDYTFYGFEKLVIYAEKDSYTIKFAKEKTIKYVEL